MLTDTCPQFNTQMTHYAKGSPVLSFQQWTIGADVSGRVSGVVCICIH